MTDVFDASSASGSRHPNEVGEDGPLEIELLRRRFDNHGRVLHRHGEIGEPRHPLFGATRQAEFGQVLRYALAQRVEGRLLGIENAYIVSGAAQTPVRCRGP